MDAARSIRLLWAGSIASIHLVAENRRRSGAEPRNRRHQVACGKGGIVKLIEEEEAGWKDEKRYMCVMQIHGAGTHLPIAAETLQDGSLDSAGTLL